MIQGFNSSPIRHLMIFLRETPTDGIDTFERQITHHASYITEGSNERNSLNTLIGNKTQIKVLVTGEIELNEKNVFIGLKMAFPDWDFQHYPLNIRKLYLKEPSWPDAKEVGVIATTDLRKTSGGNQWGSPCVLNLSPGHDDHSTRSGTTTGVSSWYERLSSRGSNGDENVDFLDNNLEIKTGEENAQEGYDEIDFASILEFAEEMASEDPNQEFPPDTPMDLDIQQDLFDKKEITNHDKIASADSRETLKDFDEEKKSRPLTTFDEGETFDFSFLDEAPSFSSGLDELDDEDGFIPQERFDHRPMLDDEEDYIPSDFLESDVEFEMEGIVDEPSIDENIPLQASNTDMDLDASSFGPILEIANKLQSTFIDRINELPLRKITLVSLAIGLTTIALSFGIKIFEPDYESIRKAAGVVDLYDWIILNDLARTDTETDQLIELWKESGEYQQFWLWFDTQWTPKISRYENIESGLRTTGWVLLSPAIVILMITFLGRATPIFRKQRLLLDHEQTNRISLNFGTYTTDWSLVDAWAKETGFKSLEVEDTRRLYRKSGSIAHPPILSLIAMQDNQVQLEVWLSTRVPTFLIPLLSDLGLEVLEAKNGVLPANIKSAVNKLLLKLGHPPLA
jgi:hypothetical protein